AARPGSVRTDTDDPRRLEPLGLAMPFPQARMHLDPDPGDDDRRRAPPQLGDDARDLLDGLAGPVDHLGESSPQTAVVIDAGEAEVGERQLAQALEHDRRLDHAPAML